MSPDTPDQSLSVAVDQLEALGLSASAARTFVALVRLGGGTAKDVSDASEVPAPASTTPSTTSRDAGWSTKRD